MYISSFTFASGTLYTSDSSTFFQYRTSQRNLGNNRYDSRETSVPVRPEAPFPTRQILFRIRAKDPIGDEDYGSIYYADMMKRLRREPLFHVTRTLLHV